MTPETAPLVARAGADVLVAGSAIFGHGRAQYAARVAALRAAAGAAQRELAHDV
jgi:ribulose-phosphate 3-epimerase